MGYVHDNFVQFIPPTLMHYVTGTWTDAAGQVAGTIAKHKAASAETAVVTIPVPVLSHNSGLKGSMLNSIEVDYELLADAATSVTAALNKVTRGADGAVAVVDSVDITQDLAAATAAATQDQHKLTVSVDNPAWIDEDEYYLLELSLVCGATVTVDVLGAVANLTVRH